jgi:hypothetical protein
MENEISYQFLKIPKNLVSDFEISYENKKKEIINKIKEELYNEYKIELRNDIKKESINDLK